MRYILYNSQAGEGTCESEARILEVIYDEVEFIDMKRISSYETFFRGLEDDAEIILCGGDGTLNRFVNETQNIEIHNNIYYFSTGTGNDFARDLGHEKGANPDYCINQYLRELPSVEVNGKKQLFLNNVGFGIDGYCCEVGDKLREQNRENHRNKPINYTAIAIKGLLFHFKPRNAIVTVDGKEYTYKKVWLAPTMNGRFYGGGMMPTPKQDRLGKDGTVSLMLFHSTGKLRTLMIFPSLFKGTHVKHKKEVAIFTGKNITVKFDRPTPLQIDGETILNVTSYSVSAPIRAESKAQDLAFT